MHTDQGQPSGNTPTHAFPLPRHTPAIAQWLFQAAAPLTLHSLYSLAQFHSQDKQFLQRSSVFCKAGNPFQITSITFQLHIGRAMVQAICGRPVTAEAQFQSQTNVCWICGGRSGTTRVFFRVLGFRPLVPQQRSWLRHCARSRKVAGLIPDGGFESFH